MPAQSGVFVSRFVLVSMASSSGNSYRISGGYESTVTFNGEAHYLDEELRKRRPSDPTWNRLFPKIRNCHSNICSAILNGATMLAIVW